MIDERSNNSFLLQDFGQDFTSESETDDSHVESGEECTSECDAEDENAESNDEWTSSNENRSGERDSDNIQASVEALEKLEPRILEEFAKVSEPQEIACCHAGLLIL